MTDSTECPTSPALVLFDLDDTLFAHSAAVGRGVTAHRATLDGETSTADDAAEVARWHALEEQHYHRYLAGELDFLGQRRARVHDFVTAYGVELDDAGEDRWYGDYYVEYEKAWSLHDDAVPCLDSLRAMIPGVRFGLITNGELAYQAPKVAAIGLERYIDHVVASGALGVTKPDARIFHHACSLFNVPPSSAVYVGDRLQTDAIGAARAGLRGIWLDRPGTATAAELAAAAASGVSVIRSLGELLPLLTSSEARGRPTACLPVPVGASLLAAVALAAVPSAAAPLAAVAFGAAPLAAVPSATQAESYATAIATKVLGASNRMLFRSA